jgi:DNA-binding CsgD family transcriptional regulator
MPLIGGSGCASEGLVRKFEQALRSASRKEKIRLPVAHGGLAIADRDANRLFQAAVTRMQQETTVGSIPVPAIGDNAAFVVHLLPLRRAAHDIFGGADTLIIATPITPTALVPSASLLNALFDLTPTEARLATDLASGLTLAESASKNGVTTKSARTYLERIFRKTGAHKQGQLVAMLKTVQPLVTPPADPNSMAGSRAGPNADDHMKS